jgi:hypothetical protein
MTQQVAMIMPRYEVEKVENAVVNMRVFRYIKERDDDGKLIKDENGKVLQKRTDAIENIAEGKEVYNVYFPQGHHIQVVGDDALKDLRLDGDPPMVDMNSGEDVPEGFNSLKALVASKTHSKRRAK